MASPSYPSAATTLRLRREAIITEWEGRVRAQVPHARTLPRRSLRDHVPILLEELAEELEHSAEPKAARAHGRERAEQDFCLGDMLEDLSLLREVTVETLDGLARPELRAVHRFFDASMRMAAEEHVRRADAIRQQDNAFRDRIYGILGHDLRNPLSAITMAAELIGGQPNLPANVVKATARIGSSAARMARMIRDLLDYTRTQHAVKLRIERGPCDAAAIVREIVDEARTANPTRIIELGGDERVAGAWDRDRLAQAVSNLLGNALEYGAPAEPVRVDVTRRGENVCITVVNRGRPIPDGARPTLFDAFQRAHAGPSRNGNLGLGLYIVREIARSHGGEAELTKSTEDGTVFTLRLPIE